MADKDRRVADLEKDLQWTTKDTRERKDRNGTLEEMLRNKEFECSNALLRVAELTPLVEKTKKLEDSADVSRREGDARIRELEDRSRDTAGRLMKKEAEVGELKAELAFLRKDQSSTIEELERKAERFSDDVTRYK